MPRIVFLAVLACTVTAGCMPESEIDDSVVVASGSMPVPPGDEDADGAFGFSEADKAECLANGGTYERRGMMGQYSCATPFADAGKTCTRESDCLGQCRVTDASATTGTCQANTDPFGCYSYIDDEGQVIGICVD